MPRTPRNGLSSGGLGQEAQRLVGADVERADDHGAPLQRGGDLVVGRDLLSSSEGASSRSRNRNSVRSRPTPSAPSSTAAAASATEPTLAPPRSSRRRACSPARSRAPGLARGGARGFARLLALGQRVLAAGRPRRCPPSPSTTSSVPSATSPSRSPRPTTAGMPSARARIAACEVAPPRPRRSPGRARGRAPPRRPA